MDGGKAKRACGQSSSRREDLVSDRSHGFVVGLERTKYGNVIIIKCVPVPTANPRWLTATAIANEGSYRRAAAAHLNWGFGGKATRMKSAALLPGIRFWRSWNMLPKNNIGLKSTRQRARASWRSRINACLHAWPRLLPRLLRHRRERPRRRRAAEQRDELAAFHSITSSARASRVGGISRPSAFAVLRLMKSSTFVAWWTKEVRRLGLAPRL